MMAMRLPFLLSFLIAIVGQSVSLVRIEIEPPAHAKPNPTHIEDHSDGGKNKEMPAKPEEQMSTGWVTSTLDRPLRPISIGKPLIRAIDSAIPLARLSEVNERWLIAGSEYQDRLSTSLPLLAVSDQSQAPPSSV